MCSSPSCTSTLWCGRSAGVLSGLRAYNPMSWSLLRTVSLLTTPVASCSSWCRIVAEVIGFLCADNLTYRSWPGVVLHRQPSRGRSATDWVSWNFLHNLETILWFAWRMLTTLTWLMFCSMKVIILMQSAIVLHYEAILRNSMKGRIFTTPTLVWQVCFVKFSVAYRIMFAFSLAFMLLYSFWVILAQIF